MNDLRPPSESSVRNARRFFCALLFLFLLPTNASGQDDNGNSTIRDFNFRTAIPPIEDIDVAQAIALVREPKRPLLLLEVYPFEIETRLHAVSGKAIQLVDSTIRYKFDPSHVGAWEELLSDRDAEPTARMCAAVFMYGKSIAAEDYLNETFEDSDFETKLNSTVALTRVYRAKKDAQLLDELADRMTELFVNKEWRSFAELDLDSGNRGNHFLVQVASILADEKKPELLPVLRTICERETSARTLAMAYICQYESDAANELMIRMIESDLYDSTRIATALARNGYAKAVPTISGLLGTDLKKNSTLNKSRVVPDWEQANVLSALLKLKDASAVPAIRRFIDSNKFPRLKNQAERLIVHLDNPDPVAVLLLELDASDATRRTASTIQELRSYRDRRCVSKFTELARTSVSFWTRISAIFALGEIPGDQASLALVDLLDADHPNDLVTLEPKKERSDGFLEAILVRKTREALEKRTGESFRNDSAKWRAWIEKNPSGK